VTFAAPIPVAVTFVDKQAADTTVAASSGPIVYASRVESRPGVKPGEPTTVPLPVAPPAVPPTPVEPAPVAAATEPPASVPAAEPEPTTQEEDPVSDLSAIRSRLGLADDADEAALDAQAATPATDPPPTATDPVTPPITEPAAEVPVAAVADVAEAWRRESTAQMAAMSKELADIKAEKAAAAKAAVLDSAVRAGKFRPAEMADWARRYDEHPGVTTDILASIAAGTAVPVAAAAAGYAGTDEDLTGGTDLDIERMFRPGTFDTESAGKKG
jgi:hypothetical protein